jgi:hypothetical protein
MLSFALIPLKLHPTFVPKYLEWIAPQKDQCCQFRLRQADDNFLETRPSEQKMR